MTSKQKRKIKAAIAALQSVLDDATKVDPLNITTRPALEIQTREAKPPTTKKKWVAYHGFFGSAKSGKDATHFVR